MKGVLTVLKEDPNDKNKIFVVCSVCSKDKELYPNPFHMFKSNFNKRIPCGCSKAPKLNEEQSYIVSKRAAEALGYTFLGWAGSYTGSASTKIRCVCKLHGEWNTGIISTLRRGVGCPQCIDKTKRKDSVTEEDFISTGAFKEGTTFKRSERKNKHGWNSYWYVTCPTCSNDKFVEAGLCSGVFEGSQSNLIRGAKPCRCSSSYAYTEDQYVFRINSETEYAFLRWEGDFKGNRTKAVVFCQEHNGEMTMTVSGLLQGSKCLACHGKRRRPEEEVIQELKKLCKKMGYDFLSIIDYKSNKSYFEFSCKEHGINKMPITNFTHGEQGCAACKGKNQKYAYIHLIKDEDMVVGLKFGITKNPNIRARQQNRLAKYKIEKFKLYEFDTVSACREAEKEIKETLPCGLFSAQDIPDGWTETTYTYNLEKVMNIFVNKGGKLC